MQIVIDIPEEMYKWVYDANKFSNDYGTGDFIDLIKNGTPLPKGHGKIIDSKEVYKFAREKFPHMNSDDGMCRGAIATALRYTTAIVEADEVEK